MEYAQHLWEQLEGAQVEARPHLKQVAKRQKSTYDTRVRRMLLDD